MTSPESLIEFVLAGASDSGKTQLWEVQATAGSILGIVKWFGRWRCYAFFPRAETVYERKCLRDVADFCEQQTNRRRK